MLWHRINRQGAKVNVASEAVQGVPQVLADVSLIDAKACAAVGAMSLSWWHDEVRAGRAPQPVIREPRCTRWRLVDVRRYWEARAANGLDTSAAREVITRAKRASEAARAKRGA